MARRFLEIQIETAVISGTPVESVVRLGFYNAITDSVKVEILKWLKSPGDLIGETIDPDTTNSEGDVILEADSAKGNVEIKAMGWEIGSTLVEILIPEGERVTHDFREGPLRLAVLEVPDGSASAHTPETQTPAVEPTTISPDIVVPPQATKLAQGAADDLGIALPDKGEETVRLQDVVNSVEKPQVVASEPTVVPDVLAAPAQRQRAEELGVDLTKVEGTGPDGIVRMQDIESSAPPKSEPIVPVTHAPSSDGVLQIRPSLRRLTIAENMVKAWNAPHAGPGIDINPVPLMELREKMREPFEKLHGVKLRYDYFVVAAVAWLLTQKKPYDLRILNARWVEREGQEPLIELYQTVNVGIATAIPQSATRSGFSELVTPVIRNAQSLSLSEIAKDADRVITDALAGKPKPQDQAGVTFIVNNTGAPVEIMGMRMPGDEFPDPIFAPDTCAILAFGAARSEGASKRMRIVMRFDHRLVDGAEPKIFLRWLQYLLEYPEQIPALR